MRRNNRPTSLHSQRERLQAFCNAQEGWRIVAHKQDQATGTRLDRPGLQAALDLARSGAIDVLLVHRVDRLSRKVRQLAQLAEELDTLNAVLLGIPVETAREPEQTALGERRASPAGERFEPRLSRDEADALYAGWRDAIARTLL